MKKTSIILAVLTMSLVMVSCGSKQYREAKSELKSLIKEEKNAESKDELHKICIKALPLAVKMQKKELDISDEENKELEELLDEFNKVYYKKIDSFVERSTSSESSSIEGIDDDDDNDYSSSSSSSEDWDALLNSYEQYVDKYISLMKKAAKGDMSAMSEYPSLLDKAEEFSDKLEEAQGSMSTSQWARYTKITNKMTQAAMDM